MIGVLMSLWCIFLGFLNIQGVIEGKIVSIFAFGFCLCCALVNLILGILFIRK
mgnify:CR=1 FL=1